MTMTRTLIALFISLLTLSGADQIWLTSAQITAGDLAALIPQWQAIPASTPLAPAPLPGVSRRVTRSQLISWARVHGVEAVEATLPASLLVERKTRRLDQAEFLEIIHEAIRQKYDRPSRGYVSIRKDLSSRSCRPGRWHSISRETLHSIKLEPLAFVGPNRAAEQAERIFVAALKSSATTCEPRETSRPGKSFTRATSKQPAVPFLASRKLISQTPLS